MITRLTLFLLGFILGTLVISAFAQNRALPSYLIYGRTAMGINKPVLVDVDGVVQMHAVP